MAKTILVVDDSTSLRLVVKMTLEGAGYNVIEAGDGQQALALLDGRTIHLVLSDLNMPVMNGLSLLAQIKQHPVYRSTPVIMLTTETSDHLQRQGQQHGSCAWIIKPFEPPQLLDAIARLILS